MSSTLQACKLGSKAAELPCFPSPSFFPSFSLVVGVMDGWMDEKMNEWVGEDGTMWLEQKLEDGLKRIFNHFVVLLVLNTVIIVIIVIVIIIIKDVSRRHLLVFAWSLICMHGVWNQSLAHPPTHFHSLAHSLTHSLTLILANIISIPILIHHSTNFFPVMLISTFPLTSCHLIDENLFHPSTHPFIHPSIPLVVGLAFTPQS